MLRKQRQPSRAAVEPAGMLNRAVFFVVGQVGTVDRPLAACQPASEWQRQIICLTHGRYDEVTVTGSAPPSWSSGLPVDA